MKYSEIYKNHGSNLNPPRNIFINFIINNKLIILINFINSIPSGNTGIPSRNTVEIQKYQVEIRKYLVEIRKYLVVPREIQEYKNNNRNTEISRKYFHTRTKIWPLLTPRFF